MIMEMDKEKGKLSKEEIEKCTCNDCQSCWDDRDKDQQYTECPNVYCSKYGN